MRIIKSRRWLSLLFVLLVAPTSSNAANIIIDNENIEALVTFTFSQFEGGFSINGSTPTSGGSFTFGEGTQLNFTGQWIDLSMSSPFSRTVYWVNPNAPSVIDAIFQWSITPAGTQDLATISGFFQAKGLGALPPGALPGDIIVEQLAGGHNPFDFSAPFLTGRVLAESPDSLPSAVPVPAAIWLFGTALVGLVGFSRRRNAA